MYCRKCGKAIPQDSEFCMHCGTKVEIVEEVVPVPASKPAPAPKPTSDPEPTPDPEPIPDPEPTPDPDSSDSFKRHNWRHTSTAELVNLKPLPDDTKIKSKESDWLISDIGKIVGKLIFSVIVWYISRYLITTVSMAIGTGLDLHPRTSLAAGAAIGNIVGMFVAWRFVWKSN